MDISPVLAESIRRVSDFFPRLLALLTRCCLDSQRRVDLAIIHGRRSCYILEGSRKIRSHSNLRVLCSAVHYHSLIISRIIGQASEESRRVNGGNNRESNEIQVYNDSKHLLQSRLRSQSVSNTTERLVVSSHQEIGRGIDGSAVEIRDIDHVGGEIGESGGTDQSHAERTSSQDDS